MSGIQTQQTREMRVDPQPTCRKDAQHMRVRDEQHGMAALHQRHRLIDGLLHTVIDVAQRLARPVMHGNLLAVRQRLRPVTFHCGAQRIGAIIP